MNTGITLLYRRPETEMERAAHEALEEGWPFSSRMTRLVRYFGRDPKILDMCVEQAKRESLAWRTA